MFCIVGREMDTVCRGDQVIDGKDPGGITEAVGWKGGGGFLDTFPNLTVKKIPKAVLSRCEYDKRDKQ